MLSVLYFFIQRIYYYLQVFGISKKIGITCINEYSSDIVLFDIACVGFLQVEQVFIRNVLFIWSVSFANILLQFLNGGMQVDNNIGKYQLLVNDVE